MILAAQALFAQNEFVSAGTMQNWLAGLSHDSMGGRKAFTPYADKAAAYIAKEFKKIGIAEFENSPGYLQQFTKYKTKFISVTGTVGDASATQKNLICLSPFDTTYIGNGKNWTSLLIQDEEPLPAQVKKLLVQKGNLLIVVPQKFSSQFAQLKRQADVERGRAIAFVLGNEKTLPVNATYIQTAAVNNLTNVVGLIKGKTLPNEYVVISAHYDHLGIGKPNAAGDSIYNGANDDASGVSAVLALAHYYKKENSNNRSILFVAFAAEEVGGFGSQYFSNQLKPEAIIAMCNLEMIGTESQWGANAAYITGFEKSDMGNIMQAAIKNGDFSFKPDPYTEQNLFYRSDNATLAKLGVPAHTISTSKMDNEKTYHTLQDEWQTLDANVMRTVARAVAQGLKPIISGKATPGRIPANSLK